MVLLHEAIYSCDLQCKTSCRLRFTLATLQKVEKCSIFLRLATQFYVARQVAKRGCYTLNFIRSMSCNGSCQRCLASCRKKLPRITAPLVLQLLWFYIATLCDWPKNSRHFINQSELKPKPIVTCSHAFFPALGSGYMTAMSSAPVVIG